MRINWLFVLAVLTAVKTLNENSIQLNFFNKLAVD